MTRDEKIALHRRMVEGYEEGFAKRVEREGHLDFGPDWKFAPDAVYVSEYFSGGIPAPIGANANFANEAAHREFLVYRRVVPDQVPVHFMMWSAENGVAWRTRFEAHIPDGSKVAFHMIDFIDTNDDGLITRWETFCDGEEFGPVVELATGVRGPFENYAAYWAALERRLAELGEG
jgi:hypothetical protein